MAEPRDPDSEDRRPDSQRADDDDEYERERERANDDHALDDVDVENEADPTRIDRWVDDDGDMVDFDFDDLRGMEGPDA
jgi:hypothetical protein